MCEADLSSADQVVIFKGDFACLQAINLTNSTTRDLVFMGGTKFVVSSQQNVVRWNSLERIGLMTSNWSNHKVPGYVLTNKMIFKQFWQLGFLVSNWDYSILSVDKPTLVLH